MRLSHKRAALCAGHNSGLAGAGAEGVVRGVGCEASDIGTFRIQPCSGGCLRCGPATIKRAVAGFMRQPLYGVNRTNFAMIYEVCVVFASESRAVPARAGPEHHGDPTT